MHKQTSSTTAPRQSRHVLTINVTAADLDDARRSSLRDDDTVHEHGLCSALPVEETLFVGGDY